MSLTPQERRVTLVIAAVQFINILDFMMVMPLGPDFARALDIPVAHIGYIGGSYTAAAAVAGLLGSLVLDRFDRRKALAVAMAGLVAATALGGLAWDLPSLLAARVLAGLFGGPAVALAIAVVTDTVAPERRGQATGMVMSSFALAAVAGVPVGLELARIGGWRLPFFAVAVAGLIVAACAIAILPPQRGHLTGGVGAGAWVRFTTLLTRRKVWLAYATVALVQIQQFMIIPNIASYVQGNLGFPREHLGLFYLIGGSLSFVTSRWAGRLVDRFGAAPVTFAATVGLCAVIYTAFIGYQPWNSDSGGLSLVHDLHRHPHGRQRRRLFPRARRTGARRLHGPDLRRAAHEFGAGRLPVRPHPGNDGGRRADPCSADGHGVDWDRPRRAAADPVAGTRLAPRAYELAPHAHETVNTRPRSSGLGHGPLMVSCAAR